MLKAIARVPGLSTVISAVLNFIPFCQYWCSALFNASLAAAQGASFEDILTGAAIGAVTSYIGAQIGGGISSATGVSIAEEAVKTSIASFTVAATGHAIAGGIAAKAQGGKFVDGFKYSALGAALTGAFKWASGDFKTAGSEQTDSRTGSSESVDAETAMGNYEQAKTDVVQALKDGSLDLGLADGRIVGGYDAVEFEFVASLEGGALAEVEYTVTALDQVTDVTLRVSHKGASSLGEAHISIGHEFRHLTKFNRSLSRQVSKSSFDRRERDAEAFGYKTKHHFRRKEGQ